MACRWVKADLHLHTCLSPCTDLDMSPRGIVRAAREKGIDLIGVCDHNSAENVAAVRRAAARQGLLVLGGMEVTSSEEVHTLVFFDDDEALLRFQDVVYAHLAGRNDERVYGEQVIVDDEDGVTGFCERLLIGATSLTLRDVVRRAREIDAGCLLVAAHIDREAFGVIGQLGFIPEDLAVDAVEISPHMTAAAARARFPQCRRYPMVAGSDAHRPGDIGMRTTAFCIEDASLAEIKKALAGAGGRKAVC